MALVRKSGGLTITNVAAQGPAKAAGLRPGDVVLSFDGRRFTTARALRRHILPQRIGTRHRVTYQRGAARHRTVVKLTRRPTSEGYVRLFLDNAPLPDFSAPRVLGAGALRLGALRGRVVILFFWAAWCDACKSVLPLLSRLHRTYGRRGATVLALGRDPTVAPLAAVARRHALRFPVLHDGRNRVGRRNRVRALPSLVLIDKRGVVRGYLEGAKAMARHLELMLRRLLSGRSTAPTRRRADLEVWS